MATLADFTLRLASKCASVRHSVATDGDNVSLADSHLSGMGENTGGVIWFLSGDAAGLSRTILSNPKDKFVFGALSPVTVHVASVGNLTLSAAQTIDGHAVTAGERVLAKNQTAPAENGVYVVAAGAWTRAVDFNAWTEFLSASVIVEEGTANADTGWLCTVAAGGTLGSTAITWEEYGIAAGDRYAFVDKEIPRDILIAAVNAGLRQVNPRLVENITLVADSEVDVYALPAGVSNLLSVEIATSLTAPYNYYPHRHWREKGGELRFDYGYAPQADDYKMRLIYRTDHVDLTEDTDALPVGISEESLFWRSLIEMISMLLALRPKKQRYLDLFQEAQIEWQRRVVMSPQPTARLAGW